MNGVLGIKGNNFQKPQWAATPDYTNILLFETVIEMISPLAVGSEDSLSSSDRPVIRRNDGKPFIPGTALAGVIRTRICEVLNEDTYGNELNILFGKDVSSGMQNDTNTTDNQLQRISRIQFDDLDAIDTPLVERRDHVRIDEKRGVAAKHNKYDMETVSVGTQFDLRVRVYLSDDLWQNKNIQTIITTMLSLIDTAEKTGLSLGGHTRRGFGRIKVSDNYKGFLCKRFKTGTADGLLEYLDYSTDSQKSNCYSISKICEKLGWIVETQPLNSGNALELSFKLGIKDSLLIRGPAANVNKDDVPDASHIRRIEIGGKTKKIVPASSITGPMRHRANAILNTLNTQNARINKKLLDILFGSESQDTKTKDHDTAEIRAGILSISESIIQNDNELRHTRVNIDPWTGGALDHCLFTEDVIFGGFFDVQINIIPLKKDLDENKDMFNAALGVLLLVLRDLWEGDLPIGGETSIGRGVVQAVSGTFIHNGTPVSLRFGASSGKLEEVPGAILNYVEALNKLLKGSR
jgi:CRISPR/Cas system CSM-associated protein Csm3 (group 7 of RAMP superfamily)